MDDKPKPPRIFANKVIKQLISHMFADSFKLKASDYQAMRVVFRSLGGTWSAIWHGDMKQLELLQKVVKGWASQPHEQSKGLI